MGTCSLCGQSAGLFRSIHAECVVKNDAALSKMSLEAGRALQTADDFQPLRSQLLSLAAEAKVSPKQTHDLVVKLWEDGVQRFLEDGLLDVNEERRLSSYREQFQLTKDEVDKNGAFTRFVKAGALREVLEGTIPKRVNISGVIPVNLQKGEQIVWAFDGSKYLEDKTTRRQVGRTQGVSIRIMSGVYYRVGAFSGQAISSTVRAHVDTGWVVITNRGIYFAGPKKGIRVPYAKIISFEPYADSVGIVRDAATAKPQIFVTGDGWFTYNLLVNLAQLSAKET